MHLYCHDAECTGAIQRLVRVYLFRIYGDIIISSSTAHFAFADPLASMVSYLNAGYSHPDIALALSSDWYVFIYTFRIYGDVIISSSTARFAFVDLLASMVSYLNARYSHLDIILLV